MGAQRNPNLYMYIYVYTYTNLLLITISVYIYIYIPVSDIEFVVKMNQDIYFSFTVATHVMKNTSVLIGPFSSHISKQIFGMLRRFHFQSPKAS